MDNRQEYIDKMNIKLKVLESKIQKLESQTDEVIHEVESEFQLQLKALQQKKEAAQQKLLKMKEIDDLG